MSRWKLVVAAGLTGGLCLVPGRAVAQVDSPAAAAPMVPSAQAAPVAVTAPSAPSRFWLTAGGASATLRSDCDAPPSPLSPVTCGVSPYRHSGSVVVGVGSRVSERLDVGVELFWMPQKNTSGHIHVTHVDAIAQFRPWASKGFFIKGGAGMAFLRNWVDAIGPESIDQKALSLVLGTGWAFRPTRRVGLQIFGSQHAGAIGDVQTADGIIQNVMGNFWSVGAAVVIR